MKVYVITVGFPSIQEITEKKGRKFAALVRSSYLCGEIHSTDELLRGATAVADAEIRPMEPETGNAGEGIN